MKPIALAAPVIAAALLAPSTVLAQADLKPDETPRLGVPGEQGLPQEDRQFLAGAAALHRLERDLAALAEERAGGEAVRRLAATLAADHADLDQRLRAVAEGLGVGVDPGARVPEDGSAPEVLARLREQSTGQGFDRAWVAEQIAVHDRLIALYQTTASQTQPDTLAKAAITGMVVLVEHREALRAAARGMGMATDPEGQPPQYGER
ncbi:DUF4142 domain-containing protein [Caenispirillum bisanense]|uniref:Predicted outer membrane protein n=1 Tax=Caenispirillum bisanense TaxID=414052 RepID=A0A286GDE1_9PROT|nr:DUF4142 domain-containing protein [Caenispirillum bisanense]SOD93520.1 Predicted outer membrane protein [Caenispirillum bisanense]